MSCCGKKRANLAVQPVARPEPLFRRAVSAAQPGNGSIVEYVGPTSLIVRGPTSGQIYRFPSPGARMVVDERDAAFLLAIPHLRTKT
jgi:hypothetical protein